MRPGLLRLLPAALGVIVLATGCSGMPDPAQRAGDPEAGRRATADRETVTEAFGKLPLRFEENRGQTAGGVDFLARGHGYTAFIKPEEAVLSLSAEHAAVVRMRVVGADPAAAGSGEGPRAGVSNYLTGPRDRWITDVPNYPSVRYAEAYPGIDLVYRGSERGLKYDFVVAPGADPDRIALAFDHGVTLDRSGDLLVDTPAGTLRHDKPFVYQEVAGRRRPVDARYVVRDSGQVGFALGRFDRDRPLVIDPAVVYSTYLGGPAGDQVAGIAVDSGGNAHVTGFTASPEFPVVNPRQPTKAGGTTGGAATDAYVAKFNPDGNGLVYSTFLGGSAADSANAIAVDVAGYAYVAGSTSSTDFPMEVPFQAAKGAGTTDDAFVAKLAPAGNTLIYSTYLGGGGVDSATGIAVDSAPIAAGGAGEAYVTGSTTSTNFPTSVPFQPAKGAGTAADAFVTRFNQAGSAPVYSTYLGGGEADSAAGIALDGAGNAYVAGTTASTNFPLASPFQPTKGAGTTSDAFVTKLPPAGAPLAYSTYLGAGQADSAASVAVDGSGAAYVTGSTLSTDFPTASAFQPTKGTGVGTDAFVTKLAPSGATLAYSTYLGAGEADAGRAIAVDDTGSAHVAGHTQSDLFPLVRPVARRLGSTDAFVTRLNPAGSSLVYSTHYGGIGQDEARAVAVDVAQNTYVGGFGAFAIEPDYFPTVNPFQGTYGGGFTTGAPGLSGDGFLAKIVPDVADRPLVTGLAPTSGDVAGGTTVVISGSGLSGATGVRFGEVPARSFVVESDQRIVAVSPGGPAGSATVTVTKPEGDSAGNPIAHFFYGEGSWSSTGAMSTSRWSQTSTLLPNGKVLVVGGRQSHLGPAHASAELYDPLTGAFQPTGSMAEARWLHSATLLRNGKVLVAGGFTTSTAALATAELYDPATGTWSNAGQMGTVRQAHGAVLLAGPSCGAHCGKVLVAGGRTTSTTLETAELYNPVLNTWESTGPLAVARHTFGADLLGDGRVLVAGGFGAGATAEIYDPRTGAWLPTDNPMSADKARATATRMADGNILVTSGWNNGPIPTADVFDFRTNRFRRVGDPVTSRWNHSAVLLPNGRVFSATGGVGGATAEVFDPVTNGYRFAGLAQVARGTSQGGSVGGSAVVLSSSTIGFEANPQVCGERCGKVLLLGNSEDPTAELYTPAPPADTGYWMVAADGGIFAFGNAPFHGSTGDIRLNQPVVGMAPTPSGNGYWMVASDGGIFAFGDAGFFGSTGDIRLSQPVVGMAATPSGNGYWMVAADGGIFAFGDAPFLGSTGDIRLNRPVVGMTATPSGNGYWTVASDGGIFAFGNAPFYGSTGDIRLNRPVVGMTSAPSGDGYWTVASDGGIFAFGNAPFHGSTGDIRLNQPMVGMGRAPRR